MRRGVSDRRRQLQRAEERVVHRLHHAATAADLAEELDAPESVVARWQAEVAAAERHPAFAGLRAHVNARPDAEPEIADVRPLPDEVVLDLELLAELHRAIGALPDRLAHVVRATWFEGRRLADVAEELGVTESRVSQLRTEAVVALRHQLQRHEHPA
jgi:RNA polymerase sigma factor for flagellar operon FliA